MSRWILRLALCAAWLVVPGAGCRSLPAPGEELAPPGADDPDEFEGELEEGAVYSAVLQLDEARGEWTTVVALAHEPHETARIDWVGTPDFAALSAPRRRRVRVVFEVISRDERAYPEREITSVTWACRILSAVAV